MVRMRVAARAIGARRAVRRTLARAPAVCALMSIIGVVLSVSAAAQSIEQDGDRVPGLPEPSIAVNFPREFGDPGGIRSALAGRGVTYAINYIGEVLGNPTGGFEQGALYDGRLELAITVDLEKAIGWKGLTFFTNGYQIHGQSISAENLGVLMPVSYIEALPATRLFELWIEQKVLDDHLSLRVGQMSADTEFVISDGAGAFLNASWGWPSIMGINLPDGGPSYPLAAPAARLAFNPNDSVGFLIGVFSGDPAPDCAEALPQKCNPYGLEFPFTSPLLLYEGAFKYNQEEGELAGRLKLGAWRYYGSFEQQSIGNNGLPIGLIGVPGQLAEHDYGFYAILDQMLYRLPGKGDPKGVAMFGRLMGAPSDGNMIDLYADGGLTFNGMFAARPHDVLGIGAGFTKVSSQIVDYEKSQRFPVVPSCEVMLELSYTAHIMQGLTLQPDFQYFWNPGGHSADPENPSIPIPDAAVFGLRSTISY
jgi:porin